MTGSIAELSAEARELAELEAEAAQFEAESQEHWDEVEEYAVELEELARDEEAAHTVSQLSMPHPHPAGSIVERMREAVRYETNRQSTIELIDDTE